MEEEIQEPSGELPDLHQVVKVVRRRRWYFLGPFFAGWILIFAVSWFLPSVYRSGTLILVEQPAVPEKLVASNIDLDIQQQLDSITQQILSRTRLLHIIDGLNLYSADRKHKTPDELVELMRKDIDIELNRGDDKKLSAFNIFYINRDPKLAQAATAELANLFITENLEQRQKRSENTTSFLQDQLDQARANLAEQEQHLREFKDKHIGELPTQTQSNLQILGGLQTQLQAQEDSLNRAKQQNTYLESLLNQYRSQERGTKSGDGTPIGLDAVNKELDRLRAQLADLSSHYTDKHPDVRKTKDQIARTEKTRERLIAEMGNGSSSPSSVPDIKSAPMLDLESQLQANRAEIANRQAEVRDMKSKIAEYQGRLNRAPVMEQQFADITRDYDQSKQNYDSLLAKRNQSEMATDLEKTQQGEHFRMLDPPNLPIKPFKPNRLLLCVLGAIVGLVLGGGVAAVPELMTGKLHSEREIKKIVPFEVLAEIPSLQTSDEEQAARKERIWAVIAAATILFCVLGGTALTYLRG